MNVAVSVGFAMAAVMAACLFVLFSGSAHAIDEHDEELADHDRQLATLAGRIEALAVWLGVEIADPVDDSPEALAAEMSTTNGISSELVVEPEADTDEFPAVQPDTEPMPLIVDPTPAVQARRDAAWDQQRPTPVPRGKSAEWVEEAIKGFNFSGRDR